MPIAVSCQRPLPPTLKSIIWDCNGSSAAFALIARVCQCVTQDTFTAVFKLKDLMKVFVNPSSVGKPIFLPSWPIYCRTAFPGECKKTSIFLGVKVWFVAWAQCIVCQNALVWRQSSSAICLAGWKCGEMAQLEGVFFGVDLLKPDQAHKRLNRAFSIIHVPSPGIWNTKTVHRMRAFGSWNNRCSDCKIWKCWFDWGSQFLCHMCPNTENKA